MSAATRHSATIWNGATLTIALAVAMSRSDGPLLATAAVAVVAFLFFSARPAGEGLSATAVWRHQMRIQSIVALLTVPVARFAFDQSWPGFLFLAGWFTLTTVRWLYLLLPRDQLVATARRIASRLHSFGEIIWRISLRRIAARDDLALIGAAVVGAATWCAGRLNPTLRDFGLTMPLLAGGAWFVVDRFSFQRWHEGASVAQRLARLGARLLIWSLALGAVALAGGTPVSRSLLGWLLAAILSLALFALPAARRVPGFGEIFRRLAVLAAVGVLAHPFATDVTVGSGDSIWYANTLADFLAQVHAGEFPVFVGQSEYLFNGGIFPVRFAPLFQHCGLVLDALTLGSLEAGAIQNLFIISALLLGAFNAYFALSRLLPHNRWIAAALSILYVGCPGVLSLVYVSDLLMTWTTLPWLPLAFVGCARSFREPGWAPLRQCAIGLGLLWWGHSPVALWSTTAIAFIQLWRLAHHGLRSGEWRSIALAAAIFIGFAAHPLISILAVPVEPGVKALDYTTYAETIADFNRDNFPGNLMPLLFKARDLADFQPGWGLLLAIAGSLIGALAWRRSDRAIWCLLAVPLLALLLLNPIHSLNHFLWEIVPAAFRNPTGNWPLQRLYIIFAAATPVAAALAFSGMQAAHPRFARGWAALILISAVWTIVDFTPLLTRLRMQVRALQAIPPRRSPENNVLTRYAYLGFAQRPAYFSHGHVDPLLEQRLLARDDRRLLVSNAQTIATSPATKLLGSGTLTGEVLPGAVWPMQPTLRIEPHRRYLLELRFPSFSGQGVLVISGAGLERVYALPSHGDALAFGAGPQASPFLSLHTSGANPSEVNFRFLDTAPAAQGDYTRFAHYRWFEWSPDQLPIHVRGWVPYRATVRAPAPAWLETPRVYQIGFRATVDGRPVEIAKSPEGLIMIPVPAGRAEVELTYHAPHLLLLGYWLSLASLVMVAGWTIRQWWRDAPDPA
jgi:hypothetical protein